MFKNKRKTFKKLAGFGPRALYAAIFDKLRYYRIMRIVPDRLFVKMVYRAHFGKKLNLSTPDSFNEKLQWLKLNYRDDRMPLLVDKIQVKDYISQVVGKDYVVPTIGFWSNPHEIDWESLPSSFVLKCSHDSGSVIICNDKTRLDKELVCQKLSQHLKTDLFYWGREWPYRSIEPRILAEPLLIDTIIGELYDYKFFCFNGKARCFKIDFGRFTEHHANYYDVSGNLLSISELDCPSNPAADVHVPSCLGKMVLLAEELSKGFPFMRVDFYLVNNQLYVGELTFFPASGLSPFLDYESDILLGSWLNISIANN